MKRNSHEDKLRLVQINELRSRIDKSLASLDCGEGVDGEKFMQEGLGGIDSRAGKGKVHPSKKTIQEHGME